MKKLHSFAFYALTPVIALGAGSVLAQQSAGQDKYGQQQSTQREQGVTQPPGQDRDRQNQSTQRDQGARQSTPITSQGDQSKQRAGQSDSQAAAGSRNSSGQSHVQSRGFIGSIPANGMQANKLIGAEVKTSGGVDVGPVSDLIINDNGQVVAIVVSVGGFLGMGDRDVAIGWDDVKRSRASDKDEQELRIGSSREELLSAPEFKKQD